MAIRTTDDLENEGSDFNNVNTAKKRANILERFDDGNENDNPYDDALQYINRKINQVIAVTNNTDNLTDGTSAVEKAKLLANARRIGGVSFDASADIDLPGVNTAGNQATSGLAATATILASARTIGGVSFNGSANIDLPGVNSAGNQATSGLAATATLAADATTLATPRAIGGVNFDGSAAIVPKQHKGSVTSYKLTPGDFHAHGGRGTGQMNPDRTPSLAGASVEGEYSAFITLPIELAPTHVVIYGSDSTNVVRVYMSQYRDATIHLVSKATGFAVNTATKLASLQLGNWRSDRWYLGITVTTNGADAIYGGEITMA